MRTIQQVLNDIKQPLKEKDGLKVGDIVTFTNDYGVKFDGLTIIGIDADESFYKRCFYLNTDAYWFPHTFSELTKTN